MGFNLSPVQLRHPSCVDALAAVLARTQIDPALVIVELTESAAMDELGQGLDALRGLAELGVSVVIDDFGAGHSSLTRLRDLPVDALKIDRELLLGVPEDPAALAVVSATAAMADALGLPTVVEGIETEAQRACVAALGCTYGPMPPAQVCELLLERVRPGGRRPVLTAH